MQVADIYCRISREGERTDAEVEKHLDLYEATCRQWIERQKDMEVGIVRRESDVSGYAIAPEDRELGELLDRIESGEAQVIVTSTVERYGRTTDDGLRALKRLQKAGGRIVFVDDGLDSDREGAYVQIGMRLLFGEDMVIRTKGTFQKKIDEAAADGKYLAPRAPRGYVRVDEFDPVIVKGKIVRDATIVPDTRVAEGFKTSPADAVVEIHTMAANRATLREMRDFYRAATGDLTISCSGVQQILDPTPGGARPYLGEMSVLTKTKGQPRILRDHHAALVTEKQWEDAQAGRSRGRAPGSGRKNGKWASKVHLAGLARCTNGHRMTVGPVKGSNGERFAGYTCTKEGCDSRTSIRADVLDPHVREVLGVALLDRQEHVAAIMEGDDRYQRALDAVEAAKADEQAWVDEMTVEDAGGREAWVRARKIRRSKVDAARAALKTLTKPEEAKPIPFSKYPKFEDAEPELLRAHFARFVDRVEVQKVGRGKRGSVDGTVGVYFHGAEESWAPSYTPEQIEMGRALAASLAAAA